MKSLQIDPTLATALITLRRDLHRHPELSGQEHRTCERLARALRDLVPTATVRRVAETGLVARVPGRDPEAPVVAIRGDIDGLPIQESTNLDFASVIDGVMHACGHDAHAAWAVGAALPRSHEETRSALFDMPAHRLYPVLITPEAFPESWPRWCRAAGRSPWRRGG